MKRIVIAVSIVLLIIGSGCWSLWDFARLREDAAPLLQAMEEYARQDDLTDAINAAEQFRSLWEEKENTLTRFVRREPLEHIGRCAARLPALGQHGDHAEFAAAVAELCYSMEELWESEKVTIGNLL